MDLCVREEKIRGDAKGRETGLGGQEGEGKRVNIRKGQQ
jgi:hypothetical protein